MFRKLRIQGRMQIFEKMSQKALNRVLTLDCSGGSDLLQFAAISAKNYGFTKQKHIRGEKTQKL